MNSDEDILQQLQRENNGLRSELYRLRAEARNSDILDVETDRIVVIDSISNLEPEITEPPAQITAINKQSDPDAKLELFSSLFRGRTDVYARHWVNATTGKSGYSPACNSFWHNVCKLKSKTGRCFDCEYSDYLPLTAAVLNRHLRLDSTERDIIGIYPLLEDDSTWLLAIDFDRENWKSEAFAFQQLAQQRGFPTSLERSRSGLGAHVWFFFAQQISAKTARRLGSALLTLAMDEHPEFSFTSYDRLFPNQDTLPKGGFGNLIALPLQGFTRTASGNSVFLESPGCPYDDQWSYLASVHRISLEAIEDFLAYFGAKETLGVLSPLTDAKDEPDGRPWDKQNAHNPLGAADFPHQLTITKANMLHIEKQGISPRGLNLLRRQAVFSNPQYYRAQHLRLYIGANLARIIDGGEETSDYLSLPRGCEAKLIDLLDSTKANYRVIDKTETGVPIHVAFSGKLRPEQRPAFRALAAEPLGILSAATAFGKTVVAARLIAERNTTTLVLVHNTQLLEQWVEKLGDHLTFAPECVAPLETTATGRTRKPLKIGYLSGTKNRLTGRVDVAMISSLLDKEDVLKESIKAQDYGLIIVDECHHVAAHSFEMAMRQLHARYVYGLTATPTRRDGLQPLVFMHCGPIRYTVSEKSQNKKRGFVHQVIPRFTSLQLPDAWQEQTKVNEVYAAITDNEERNDLIVNDVFKALDEGRTPLILTQTTRQVKLLTEALRLHCPNVILLTGGRSAPERRATNAQLAHVAEDEPLALVATGKFAGEGFDFPRLDTLFIAAPVSWKGILQQYAGRLNRSYKDKRLLQIYDYIDIGIQVSENMYFKRLKHYKAQDYQILEAGQPDLEGRCVFDGKEFWEPLFTDISQARKEIVIACPRLYPNSVDQTTTFLSERPLKSDLHLTIITSALSAYPEQKRERTRELHKLLGALPNTTLVLNQKQQNSFTIIDRATIWFGNTSPLSYASAEQSIMRIISRELAERLLTQ